MMLLATRPVTSFDSKHRDFEGVGGEIGCQIIKPFQHQKINLSVMSVQQFCTYVNSQLITVFNTSKMS